MTEFLLLGPLELRVAGRAVELGPPQRRAVLAALLVDAGRPVPLETLIDRVWGEDPPAEARASLYSHAARIRRTLAAAASAASAERDSGSGGAGEVAGDGAGSGKAAIGGGESAVGRARSGGDGGWDGTDTDPDTGSIAIGGGPGWAGPDTGDPAADRAGDGRAAAGGPAEPGGDSPRRGPGPVPRLLRGAGGYRLDVPPEQIDLHRFLRAVELAGQPGCPDAERAGLLREAGALWRGEPLAGLGGDWAARVRESWRQRYLDAVVQWAHAELRCGNHAAVTGRLAELVGEYPLVEPLTAALMTALSASGRAPEALARYAALRERLAEELGTDPGRETRRVHETILRGDPVDRRPAVRPRPASSPPLPEAVRARPARPLVGRAPELAVLERAIAHCTSSARTAGPAIRPWILDIAGEPGIGKSRLLDELAERAGRHGLLTLAGRGAQYDPATPYGAFVDALDDHLTSAATTARLPPATLRHLGAVFPALGDGLPPQRGAARAERYWLHGAVRSLLDAVSGDRGLVLALDDLHWADDGTVELIDHLLRHPPRAALLLALAHRPRQLSPRLSTGLARAEAEGRAVRLELGPLSAEDAAPLYGKGLGPGRWRQLYEAGGGNPFYLEALARLPSGRLTTNAPLAPVTDVGELPLPVRHALLAELEGLPDRTRTAAQAAAVLGDSFTADATAAVADGDRGDVLAALDDLAERDLVRAAGAAGRFRFRHPLVRAAVYEGTGVGWRIGAHARAARHLAQTGAPLTAQAAHVERSAQPGDGRAAELLARAARSVLTIAPSSAAHWTAEALRLLGEEGRRRTDLWFQRATALGTAGRLSDSRELLRALRPLLPADAGADRVRVVVALSTMEWMLGGYDEAVRLLRHELADHGRPELAGRRGPGVPGSAGPEPAGTTQLEQVLAAVAQRTDDFPAALHWSERALRSAESAGDPVQAATARGLLTLACTSAGQHTRALHELRTLDRALDEPERDEPGYLDALIVTGWTDYLQGRYESALVRLDRGLELSRRTGNSMLLTDLFAVSAYAHLSLGNLDEADRCADEALETASFVGSDEASTFATAVRAAVHLWRGDVPGALKIFEDSGIDRYAAEDGPDPTGVRAVALGVLSNTLLLHGDPHAAVRTLVRGGGGPALPRIEAPTRSLWFAVLVSAELARGDTGAAEEWAARSASAVTADGPRHQRAFVDLARAEIHLARRDFAAAADRAHRAAAEMGACRMPLYEAIARIRAGAALAGLPSGPAAARAELAEAGRLSERCGAHGLSALAELESRRIDGRPTA
ncbi:BTAD domain-containing putative transcriptional regulator [Streptomyces luteolifulvus]|uniref:BTAD domain-containing putative transcriptional regulator n=1 Tax=Streptomyces luteolifulvus TaxID=2615112 RepID=UPI001CDA45FD|nr:BTAD domain-containing putative transcriptional regulator [Streptomyces luteolifulvus]